MSSFVVQPTLSNDDDLRVSYEKAALSPTGKEIEHREQQPPSASSELELVHEAELAWFRIRLLFQDAFAEFFGVFILILFGDGSVAQVVLSGGVKGEYQSISWGWG